MRAFVHRLLNRAGIEVRFVRNLKAARVAEKRNGEVDAWRILSTRAFRTILDIGANEGQFARIARTVWPEAVIHSFEPLPQAYAALKRNFAGDPKFNAHNIALGSEAGTTMMNACEFSPSSSLLPMAQCHRDEWPQTASHTEVAIHLARLDDWARDSDDLQHPMLVKLDVQGYELRVVDGGCATLSSAEVVVLEVSFNEFYEGQPLFADIHDRMHALGFTYRGNIEQYISKDKRSVLYADAIFENTRLRGETKGAADAETRVSSTNSVTS